MKKFKCYKHYVNSQHAEQTDSAPSNSPVSTPKNFGLDHINSLPNNKTSTLTKLKALAEDKLNVAKMIISVFVRVENIVGKGENMLVSYRVFQSLLL